MNENKRPYTNYVFNSKRLFGKPFELNIADAINKIKEIRANAIATTTEREMIQMELVAMGLQIEQYILRGDAVHIYLTSKEFCDWIIDSSKFLASEHLRVMNDILNGSVAVFHFKTGSGYNSFAFKPVQNNRDEYSGAYISLNDSNTPIPYFAISTETDLDDPIFSKYARLICGVGLYINCFPETVVSGVPTDLKHPSHHNNTNNITIGISNSIRCRAGSHSSPCGHFRSGHFRYLGSDRFKKKRFQTIFIQDTFVNGTASTVLSPEDISKTVVEV